jgi:hypothetical protein
MIFQISKYKTSLHSIQFQAPPCQFGHNELLEKDRKWVWNERCNRAFLKVKDMITSDVVLTHYDPNLPVRLACDASPV